MENRFFFHTLILVAIFLLFFIPVILYTFKFGVGLWETHDDWSLMGSALGGDLWTNHIDNYMCHIICSN